jgi:hypothetical protein
MPNGTAPLECCVALKVRLLFFTTRWDACFALPTLEGILLSRPATIQWSCNRSAISVSLQLTFTQIKEVS